MKAPLLPWRNDSRFLQRRKIFGGSVFEKYELINFYKAGKAGSVKMVFLGYVFRSRMEENIKAYTLTATEVHSEHKNVFLFRKT